MLIYIESKKLIINTNHIVRAERQSNGGVNLSFVDRHSEMIHDGADELWELLSKDADIIKARQSAPRSVVT
jgi:hypothetical protein